MKFLTQQSLLVSALLLSALSSQADTVKYSAPAEYCFPQTSVRSELGKFDKVILDHNLIVNEQDHFKFGDIFVGFRRKSQPDILWLTNGTSWLNASDNSNTTPKAYSVIFPNGNAKLQPVIPITLSHEPIDVSAYVGDGEVWVGYGLRSEGETGEKSYQEMISNRRFNKIWEITGSTPASGLPGDLLTICLTATEMETTTITTTHTH
ncbi:MAG TPA: hypothetical protein PLV19_00040 [Nitrosomonas sp.]|nr:hypothetical protein [Nitrosomonas sp.]HQX12550.1 hypothetical protein [Nitrosomonas sp.]HRB32159.1 hypothetical protein [Nitrosomonas sp.]HRB44821.1 hypothetical protein [Nitrosomonas sp.]HRB77092.1 hypothetical protein [Nitrosomonas sp.]